MGPYTGMVGRKIQKVLRDLEERRLLLIYKVAIGKFGDAFRERPYVKRPELGLINEDDR